MTNYKKTLDLVELSSRHRPISELVWPICQTKITGHISADILFDLSANYETLSRDQKLVAISTLSEAMMSSRQQRGTAYQDKLTSGKLLGNLREEALISISNALPRLYDIGAACKEKKVILTVDAEYTYVNKAIGLFTLAMMAIFNKEKPVVWNTYQGYLKKGKEDLAYDYHLSKDLLTSFGAKIVRGAYLQKEREYAKLNGTPDLTNESYEHTNDMYNSMIDYLIPEVSAHPEKCHMIVATNNEKSVINATQNMKKHSLKNNTVSVIFGQVYGMAENISVPLGLAGYNTYKSVAYGSVGEALPYLSRRANENRGVFYGARKERSLLRKEIQARVLRKKNKDYKTV